MNAYVTVLRERASERAKKAAEAVDRGDDLGPLHGVPVAIKDICPVADVRLTFGSQPFADNTTTEDAIVVDRLLEAGGIVMGKTNTPEFGHKGTTDNKLHGPTYTLFDLEDNAGGSSGGSAAVIADGLARPGREAMAAGPSGFRRRVAGCTDSGRRSDASRSNHGRTRFSCTRRSSTGDRSPERSRTLRSSSMSWQAPTRPIRSASLPTAPIIGRRSADRLTTSTSDTFLTSASSRLRKP